MSKNKDRVRDFFLKTEEAFLCQDMFSTERIPNFTGDFINEFEEMTHEQIQVLVNKYKMANFPLQARDM